MRSGSRVLAVVVALIATSALTAGPASARVVQRIGATGPSRLVYPSRVAIGPGGQLYVLEGAERGEDPYRIVTYSPTGRRLRGWPTLASSSVPDLAVDAVGSAYTVAWDGNEILKFSPAGRLLARWRAPSVPAGRDDHAFLLAVDNTGNVLAVEGDGRIETFDAGGELLSTLRLPADFIDISGIAVGRSGTIYIAARNGIAALDPALGTLRLVVGRDRLRRVSPGWTVATGLADSIYAVHAHRIERFGSDGTYHGSVGGDRRAHWLGAAIASDGSIFVAQFGSGLGGGSVVQFAPITTVDEVRPSLVVTSVARPSRRSRPRARLLARVRYTLSEAAQIRVSLAHRSRSGRRFYYVGTVDLGLTSAGGHTLRLDLKAFGLSPPPRSDYQLTFVAQDDAGNESLPALVSLPARRR
jgi:hypothetical protein